ncbi:BRCA1-A complex subunit RAP80 isoform X2 [Antennarius striatus]|uniref:BRCA1-A complex subunit RAP80 isoform X2 n=1 Tax=Antennarius striatus TaxID=241820 RepID=UPI0035B46460
MREEEDGLHHRDESSVSPSSSRDKRRRNREHRSRPNKMTEDEMMDLALRLSEQEASITALRRQKEEEAVMKALQESVISQTCPPPQCPSETSCMTSRQKRVYSNGKLLRESHGSCSPQTHLSTGAGPCGEAGARGLGGEESQLTNVLQRRTGSPLLEMPDLSQTQKITSQASPCTPDVPHLLPNSPQRCDSTRLEACQLRDSPVFPSTGHRAEVHVPRLSQDLLQTCRTSGFVWCSPDSPVQPKSPTFPKSPELSENLNLLKSTMSPGSPVFCVLAQGEDGETDASPERVRSPVFGCNAQRESPHACRCPAGVCNSGFTSQESLGSSVRFTTCQPKSPVFPRSPSPPSQRSATCNSTVNAGADGRVPEPSHTRCSSPVSRRTGQTLVLDPHQQPPLGSPSPVFPEEGLPAAADDLPDRVTESSPGAPGSSRPCESSTSTVGQQRVRGTSAVHYYWGVPFCPGGLDPDHYTQVIVAQMEVYEKSLKQAQRRLLRKAGWRGAVLPQPEKSPESSSESCAESSQAPFPERGLRPRSKTLCDDDDPPAEEEENEKRKNKEGLPDEGGGQVDTDCDVCPETQMSHDDDGTRDLMTDTGGEPQAPAKSLEMPEVEMMVQKHPSAQDEPEDEEMEVDLDVDVEQRMKGQSGGHDGGEHGRMEDGALPRSPSPELELSMAPQSPGPRVDCPICQGHFPASEIEMHAAFCDGDEASSRSRTSCSPASLKPRRKRPRRAETAVAVGSDNPNIVGNKEKCYICQKLVSLREYSRHTELCIHQQTSTKEGLLSALEEAENRDSGARPSGSKLQTGDVIDLRDDDDDDGKPDGVSAIRISRSPIRSFTPISEATDCLIDFKRQYQAKKLSHRRH